MRVAGLAPVNVPGIEDFNCSEHVPGHMSYRAAMPKLLRLSGWSVESDEFAEIEDPDPDNHEKRQRELINEIEEARKELEKKPEKRRWGLFKQKKYTEKKYWETYDERAKAEPKGEEDGKEGGVLFDVDAIRAEAAELAARTELAAEGYEVKQLESTLGPMKLDLSRPDPTAVPALATSKSYNDSLKPNGALDGAPLSRSQSLSPKPTYDSWDSYDTARRPSHEDDNVSMTFDTSFTESPRGPRTPAKDERSASAAEIQPVQQRPPLNHAATTKAHNVSAEHNAWADEDEDDFGKEKEMKMTFE